MIYFGVDDYVCECIDSSSESRIFLHGNRALILAACEKFPAVVKRLLDREADTNFQNKDGSTPQMEVALWAHFENVKLLLRHGADKNLWDSNGLKAIGGRP